MKGPEFPGLDEPRVNMVDLCSQDLMFLKLKLLDENHSYVLRAFCFHVLGS